jgi:hypothetical protein
MKQYKIYIDKHDGSKNYTIYATSREQAVQVFRSTFGYKNLIDIVVEIR